ncbi:unnamed protein product [Rotaria magnacalcarata]|uniref:Uncharacterized protein n=3 Tax=Rotaria magnacalcarata TaxID=392030 RepID=A0A820TX80_9BILA|nr:unnamed protein product [Rotaria magnacalcarata]
MGILGIPGILGIRNPPFPPCILSLQLPNYIRHLTNRNACVMVQQKLEHLSENSTSNVAPTFDEIDVSTDGSTNHTSDLNSFTQTSLGKRKRNKASNPSLAKKKKKI